MAAWVTARLTPHPLSTYAQPIPVGTPASAALPRALIHWTAGPITPRFAPFAQQARAVKRGLHTVHETLIVKTMGRKAIAWHSFKLGDGLPRNSRGGRGP